MNKPDTGSHFEEFKNATAASVRTIAGLRDLDVTFSNSEPPIGRVVTAGKPRLPLPDYNMNAQSLRLVRGCADAQALRIAHHDEKTHRKLAPKSRAALEAFNAMEQARVEAIGHRDMSGVAHNLNAVLEEKCRRLGFGLAHEREQVPLNEALHVMTRLALTGETIPPSAENVVKMWQPWLKEKLGKNFGEFFHSSFGAMDPGFRRDDSLVNDQAAFATLAKKLITALQFDPGEADAGEEESSDNDSQSQRDAKEGKESKEAKESIDPSDEMGEGEAESDAAAGLEETDEGGGADDGEIAAGENRRFHEDYIPGPEGLYTVYTHAFDEEIDAKELADEDELTRLRQMLDRQLGHHQTVITKLANRLMRKLMAKQRRTWQFDLEEGILDVARLARVVANPNVPLTFKQEKEMPFRDTVVTLLIDNSGSMRGRPIAIAAMTTDIIARTLERCGVKVEILGFTTRQWKGGKSRDLWMQSGRPANPGRLNDIRHIIYKAADAPMRRTRRNLGLMLKEGLLKENIDGEALVWAYNRLAPRNEERKIMMVISDGAPVDDSTLSVNPPNYLEMDLRNVIRWIESESKVELTAIGIGHDVTRYYKKALTITDADELAKALADQLADLFEEA
ncbi:MAG: cobaltochelatase subunit CobT [Alphaproteobacteria bacterium PRO2]|nr:cobaltochelatase subunit CobT [Alphaproteobacteria bacterium PRO2]